MKKVLSSISIVVLLMIVMSSIVQFHHHDFKGNIVFAVTTMCCDNSNEGHHSHEKSSCHHCHHEDHECDNGEDCSAHLGDYQATKQTLLSFESYPTLLSFATICKSTIYNSKHYFCKEISHFKRSIPLIDGVSRTIGLRAPPFC